MSGAAIDLDQPAFRIADSVRARRVSATEIAEAALARIAARDGRINAFTAVFADRARAEAAAVDRAIAKGRDPGPLAGVPIAAKNIVDVAGVVTLSGSKINASRPPAARDATIVARLCAAGAVLVGALNMDEYAYGFSTENAHHGPTHNPHDVRHSAGGSSGGSGAAVAAGLVPIALGTDTNGSIRVPSSFNGAFGLKPTFGRVSRAGVGPLAPSFDHVGPIARSARDLALAHDAMQGPDPADPVASERPASPVTPALDLGIDGLRVAVLRGHFAELAEDAALDAVASVARALGAAREVILPEAHRARAAAIVITACEAASIHRDDLMSRPHDFDPMVVDRLLAGALLPASAYVKAQRFRTWYRARAAEVFRDADVLLAPTTPWPAPELGAPRTRSIRGVEVVTRPHTGVFTQPISFIGLPVISVPIVRPGALPIGVQLIAAPFHEAALVSAAAFLEREGVVSAPVAG